MRLQTNCKNASWQKYFKEITNLDCWNWIICYVFCIFCDKWYDINHDMIFLDCQRYGRIWMAKFKCDICWLIFHHTNSLRNDHMASCLWSVSNRSPWVTQACTIQTENILIFVMSLIGFYHVSYKVFNWKLHDVH